MCKLLFAKFAWRFCFWLAASCLAPGDEGSEAIEAAADRADSPPIVLPIAPDARTILVQRGADGNSIALLFADEAGAPIAAALLRPEWSVMERLETPAPRPLNLDPDRVRADERLGAMQRRYRALLEEGQIAEAAEVASELMENNGDRSLVPADLVEPAGQAASGRRHHQVGYGPSAVPGLVPGAPQRKVDWQTIAKRPISFDFENASVVEIAGFFRHVAGMPVRLDLPADRLGPGVPGVYARCTGKPVGEALQIVLGSCGLGYVVENGEIRITEPQRVDRLVSEKASQVQDAWRKE